MQINNKCTKSQLSQSIMTKVVKAKPKALTKAELNLMNIIWDKGQATVTDLLTSLPEPKPAYTTVLSVMQILTKKQVLTFEKQNKANSYIPQFSREEYLNNFIDEVCDNLFQGSAKSFLAFFIKHEKISKKDVEEIFLSA